MCRELGSLESSTPIIPTIDFVLIAAFLFSKSSDCDSISWLVNHRSVWAGRQRIGGAALGFTKRLKTISIIGIVATFTVTLTTSSSRRRSDACLMIDACLGFDSSTSCDLPTKPVCGRRNGLEPATGWYFSGRRSGDHPTFDSLAPGGATRTRSPQGCSASMRAMPAAARTCISEDPSDDDPHCDRSDWDHEGREAVVGSSALKDCPCEEHTDDNSEHRAEHSDDRSLGTDHPARLASGEAYRSKQSYLSGPLEDGQCHRVRHADQCDDDRKTQQTGDQIQ